MSLVRLVESVGVRLMKRGGDMVGSCPFHDDATLQAMLGHAELSTTQIYTQVSIRTLKDIHTATHPGRPITRASRRQENAGDPHDLLLAALDAEAAEDDG